MVSPDCSGLHSGLHILFVWSQSGSHLVGETKSKWEIETQVTKSVIQGSMVAEHSGGDQERLPDTDRKEEITCDTRYMWNRKEMIQMNLQNRNRLTDLENNLCLPEAGGGDGHVHTAIFKMGNQQGAAIQCMGLCSVLCGSLYGRRVWGSMDTCICMAESLHGSSETVTLLIGYIPIQNESFFFFF